VPQRKRLKIRISAVVPVFNEEKTVAGVVETLLKSPRIDEVIAVNDGSRDQTAKILKSFGKRIIFLNYRKNRGKGFALAKGIKKAQGEVITFWDADFINLQQHHIEALLNPILRKEAQVVIGYPARFKNAYLNVFQTISGERAYYRRDLLPHLSEMSESRFGIEVYLNEIFKEAKTVIFPYYDLRGLFKNEKFGSQKAVQEYTKEGLEIAQALLRQQSKKINQDWGQLKKLSSKAGVTEIQKQAQRIKNPQVRQFLNDYVFRYLKNGVEIETKTILGKAKSSKPSIKEELPSISAIVPAWNEEKAIAKVVEALLQNKFISEVIAVNDGSRDQTAKILKSFGKRIIFLNYRKNRGKGFALAQGIKTARGKIVTFWDADLPNLSDTHLETVLRPILQGRARAAIGYRYYPVPVPHWIYRSRDLSGQRAYYRSDLLPHLQAMVKTRFGVEVYLNTLFKEDQTAKVPIHGLRALYRQEKSGVWKGTGSYIKTGIEITKTLIELDKTGRVNHKALKLLSRAQDLPDIQKALIKLGNENIKNLWENYILHYLKFSSKRKRAGL
jgi:glycosyltransferase involved in cell wall biosynthesis